MVPGKYAGIWRRDWIERRRDDGTAAARDTQPAIWFQSRRFHVDLRIDRALTRRTSQDMPQQTSQIAFAGHTEVRLLDGRELCRWWPACAYPQRADEVDAGYMTFESATHLREEGVDARYVESWRRINRDDEPPRCLRFEAVHDCGIVCYLMSCGTYLAWGTTLMHQECPFLPMFAWGERIAGSADLRVRECLAPWWIGREIELENEFDTMLQASPSTERTWCLPMMPSVRWLLVDTD